MGQNAYSQPSSEDLMTKAATLAISSSERRPPTKLNETITKKMLVGLLKSLTSGASASKLYVHAGMAFFPLVTWVITDFSERPPLRYWSRASFSKVFSGMMTFCPPAWQAAQLALKTCSPAPASAAKTGEAATTAAAAPATAPLAICVRWIATREQEG